MQIHTYVCKYTTLLKMTLEEFFFLKVKKMESQLEKHSKQAKQIQEQKVQHEEAVIKLRHSEREMRNTLEKFAASIQVLCLCSCSSIS